MVLRFPGLCSPWQLRTIVEIGFGGSLTEGLKVRNATVSKLRQVPSRTTTAAKSPKLQSGQEAVKGLTRSCKEAVRCLKSMRGSEGRKGAELELSGVGASGALPFATPTPLRSSVCSVNVKRLLCFTALGRDEALSPPRLLARDASGTERNSALLGRHLFSKSTTCRPVDLWGSMLLFCCSYSRYSIQRSSASILTETATAACLCSEANIA